MVCWYESTPEYMSKYVCGPQSFEIFIFGFIIAFITDIFWYHLYCAMFTVLLWNGNIERFVGHHMVICEIDFFAMTEFRFKNLLDSICKISIFSHSSPSKDDNNPC